MPFSLADIDDLAAAYAASRPHLDGLAVRITTHGSGAVFVTWTKDGMPLVGGGGQLVVNPVTGRFVEGTSAPPRMALAELGLAEG